MDVDGAALGHRGGSPIPATGSVAAAQWGHSWVWKGPCFCFSVSLVATIL